MLEAQKIPTAWRERENLRETGQFWTPRWIAEAMIQYVCKADLIFDPAIGNGAFLEALRQNDSSRVAFYGFDVDEKLLSSPIFQTEKCLVEKRDFLKAPPLRKFPAIVSNPPYIRHHRLDEETKTSLKNMAARIAGFSLDGRAGYHIYFLIQALNLLEENGKLAIILPADACEGVFANKLWRWITENFQVEAVVTFDEKAAPFPKIDTNAIIFFIRNAKPKISFSWVKVQENSSFALKELVAANFSKSNPPALEVFERNSAEALKTGFSRPAHHRQTKFILADFAKVMRGIATGANEFFFLTKQQAKDLNIASEFLQNCVGRTRDIIGDVFTTNDLQRLDQAGRPTQLLSIEKPLAELPPEIIDYLQKGVALKLPERSLIGLRNPWYKQEKRKTPEFLFAYLGRRSARFIRNEAQVVPLHCLHCVYTHEKDARHIANLRQILNHPDTLQNLHLVSKSYGAGALKAEPQNLKNLPLPDYLVEKFGLETTGQTDRSLAAQFSLF
jgi:hypothetical protein